MEVAMRNCAICASETDNPYFCHLCGTAAPGCDPALSSDARDRDLQTEAHLRALGLWFRSDAALFGMAAAALAGALWFGSAQVHVNYGGSAAHGRFFIGALVVLGAAALWFVVGHGLGRLSEHGRVGAAIVLALS